MNTESVATPAPAQKTPAFAKTDAEFCPRPIQLKHILVPIDLSMKCLKALEYAASFASQYGAKITLLHLIDPADIMGEAAPAFFREKDLPTAERELAQIRERHIPSDIPTGIFVRHDAAANGILIATDEFEPDLVIVATHGRTGLPRLFLGSTAEKVIRSASCPVLVVREGERDFA